MDVYIVETDKEVYAVSETSIEDACKLVNADIMNAVSVTRIPYTICYNDEPKVLLKIKKNA